MLRDGSWVKLAEESLNADSNELGPSHLRQESAFV